MGPSMKRATQLRSMPEQDLLSLFENATPQSRGELVEQLVKEYEGDVLRLPGNATCRANLQGAALKGFRMGGACLSAADLRGADLRAAFLAETDLTECLLDRALMVEADMVGASLARAEISETDLRSSLLEDANFESATMRFSHFDGAVLEGANLSNVDAWGATFENADMRGANLRNGRFGDCVFRSANLSGADLRGCILTKSELKDVQLQNTDLRDANMAQTNLSGADLTSAKLQGQDLNTCTLANVRLSGAYFSKTQFSRAQVGQKIGEEQDRNYEAATKGYLALERNFTDLGESDSASWAYRKRRRMQKLDAAARTKQFARNGMFIQAIGSGLQYFGDLASELVCDYGESVWRVLGSIVSISFVFTIIYGITGSVVKVHDGAHLVTYDPLDLFIFSLLAMTTSGSPAVDLLPRNEYVHLLTGTQAGLGIFLTGLLGFVAGNKIRR